MAIVPKGARKRASKKSSAKAAKQESELITEAAEATEVAEKTTIKMVSAPSIPVPMFQAAPEEVAPKKAKAKAAAEPKVEVDSDEGSDSDSNSRRRRRGGRGRRRGGRDADESFESSEVDPTNTALFVTLFVVFLFSSPTSLSFFCKSINLSVVSATLFIN